VADSSLDLKVLERIQAYVRRYARDQRQVDRIGPFLATFGLHSSGPYLNYAVPDDGSEPTRADVSALIAAYDRRGLRPRVELVAELCPGGVAVLTSAGFELEGSLPLMVCDDRTLRSVATPIGVEISFPTRETEYMSVVEVRQEAFEEPGEATQFDAARARASVDGGGTAVLAIEMSSGQAIGSGACLVPYGGVTELTSVGVRPNWRRRGVGALVTAALTQAALQSGTEMVFLSPAHDEGERLYEGVGFIRAGESLHMGR
jgi:GNAT superfamily N-acetyltransferase